MEASKGGLELERSTHGDILYVRLAGHLDAIAENALAVESEGQSLMVNFADIESVSEDGSKQWNAAVSSSKAASVYYVDCPPPVVGELNRSDEFRGPAQVVSIFVPYLCESCDQVAEILEDSHQLPPPDTVDCAKCSQPMKLDVDPAEYTKFLKDSDKDPLSEAADHLVHEPPSPDDAPSSRPSRDDDATLIKPPKGGEAEPAPAPAPMEKEETLRRKRTEDRSKDATILREPEDDRDEESGHTKPPSVSTDELEDLPEQLANEMGDALEEQFTHRHEEPEPAPNVTRRGTRRRKKAASSSSDLLGPPTLREMILAGTLAVCVLSLVILMLVGGGGVANEELKTYLQRVEANELTAADGMLTTWIEDGTLDEETAGFFREQITRKRKRTAAEARKAVMTAWRNKQYDMVASRVKSLRDLTSLDPDILFIAAESHRLVSRGTEASDLYDEFTQKAKPDDRRMDDALFWRAEYLNGAGETAEARELWQRITDDYPKGNFVRSASRKLSETE